MTTITIRTPFPVRLPYPVRWQGGEMLPHRIHFDGKTIHIKYHAQNPRKVGWWSGATTHEIQWLRGVKTPEQVIAHHARGEQPRRGRKREEIVKQLLEKARFTRCGAGSRVRLDQAMLESLVGVRAGGKNLIYLISQCHGTLLVPTCHLQQYPLRGFRIGTDDEWPDAIELGEEPIVVNELSRGE